MGLPESRHAATPRFWRDAALPFVELRCIEDGRQVGYGRHSHACFSLGAVTGGQCRYSNREREQLAGAGTVVLMNPGDVHACNPVEAQGWSYLMLYVDPAWLARLQAQRGPGQAQEFRRFASIASDHPGLYQSVLTLRDCLLDPHLDIPSKSAQVHALFEQALDCLVLEQSPEPALDPRLARAAQLIEQHCGEPLDLDRLCRAAQLSASQLIRGFRQRYGLTPHAYLLNRRIQFAHTRLKSGASLAAVAQEAGFADQAHLQRTFKQLLAATPGQYRSIR